jgi:hypothetical protein
MCRLHAAHGDENWDELIGNPGVAESVGGIGVVLYGNDLHVFGAFNSVGGVAATNIAKREGVTWVSLAGGVRSGHIAAASASVSDLYVGGSFSTAGIIVASNVARWDGTSWAPLGAGINGLVRAIAVRGNEVFVGGSFTLAGGVGANNIAKWDGTNWSALGDGIVPVFEPNEWVGAVDSLAVSGTDLFVGGRFRNAGGIGATNIARWDGTNWYALGNGLRYFDGTGSENGAVRALAVINGVLYAGGEFRLAGDVEATNIARWDGSSWQPVGSGVNDLSECLSVQFKRL